MLKPAEAGHKAHELQLKRTNCLQSRISLPEMIGREEGREKKIIKRMEKKGLPVFLQQ